MNLNALNVLLADDDDDDRMLFKEALEELKVKTNVILLHDGIQLMNFLNDPEMQLPDIVFLDLNMPKKGGIQCLQEIRSDKRLKDLSVAIYSTSASEKDIEETFIKGANVYIKKPNDFSSLKKILSEVISMKWQYHTSGLNKEHFLLSL